MITVLVWTLVALVAAAVVVVVARATTSEGTEGPTFLADLRAGLASRRNPDADQVAAAQAAEVEPLDVRLDEFLWATAVEDDGYLQVDEVRDVLVKAREKAVHSVQVLARRSE